MIKVSNNIINVGVDDKNIDLFEGQYKVPFGMRYNSYLILDDKTCLLDTVDINFKDEKVIPYDGEWNAYYLPGDIIRFTTTDVKMLNVKKTPFKYCFRKDNLPIRQLDINTKEHYLIIEIYYTKWGEATLLLKDHKGYLLAIDYPVGFSDENKEVIEVIDSIAPYDEELEDMRYEAYENDSKAEEAMREAAEEEEERKRIEKERLDNYIREVKFNC